ncbi:formyltransferase family protein [Helicobacter sp.]|uniref:methionyl-tRNA formyltransferase n=1 Tax=Helicobacter sp. TaxID=218 RepID=UPI00258FB042|nr:formyltransferase family protein [Helicobacter sp.]MCI7765134.1 hypothetical protein [Helicobacter sp.]
MKRNRYSYIFLSSTNFGKEILQTLLNEQYIPKAIFSIPKYFSISYSKEKICNCDFFDFSDFAEQYQIPFYWVESPEQTLMKYKKDIMSYNADFILVAGWYYKIPLEIYTLTRMGAFGFHNSLLPKYAGGAPLVWAMINGEKMAGVTLFRMNEVMDQGDIISQRSFLIDEKDTIAEVLEKAKRLAITMSLELFEKPIVFTPQEEKLQYYPQRSPKDGKIDLSWDSVTMYNFIRAQSSPYPGAYIETIDGNRLVIDKAHIVWGGGG